MLTSDVLTPFYGSFNLNKDVQSDLQFTNVNGLEMAIVGRVTDFINTDKQFSKESLHNSIFHFYQKDPNLFQYYLDGLFVIFIYDKSKQKFTIHNNRYQASTLYYALINNNFFFSSSLKKLIQRSEIKSEIHIGSLLNFVSNGFTSCEQTQIKHIKKLLPSFTLELSSNGLKNYSHWDKEFDFKRRSRIGNLEDELDNYEHIYQKGISKYIDSMKPSEIGTLLSGGHDTSFALIQSGKVHNKPIHGFTASFPGWAFDESAYAKHICKKFNHIHHEVPFLPDDLDYIVSLIRANDEPVVGSSLPVHMCAKEASKHVDLMLAGDGGDTLWGEYYPVEEIHKYIGDMPYQFRHLAHGAVKTIQKFTDWERFWELEHVLSLFDDKQPYHDFLRRLCTYRHYNPQELHQLFRPDFAEGSSPEVGQWTLPFDKNNFSDRLIEAKLFNGFYMYQSFHTTKSMNHFNLELYLPTINHDLMQFITRLPKKWVNGGTTLHRLTNNKSINRRFHKHALARYLDKEEIYNRSFDIPWYNILRPRKHMLEKLKESLLARNWYQPQYLEKLFKEFQSQQVKEHELLELKHHGYRIFTLLSAEIWCREYLDGKFTESVDQKIKLEDYLGA